METCVCVYSGDVANELYHSQSRLKATGHRVSCCFIVTLTMFDHARTLAAALAIWITRGFRTAVDVAHSPVLQKFIAPRTITFCSRTLIVRGSFE
jgi:hypothetical protein